MIGPLSRDSSADWPGEVLADPGHPRQVLVVDDSRMQRKLLSTALRNWGYEVTEAASGQEGLACCAAQKFDVIISDWMMPGMDGPEFCAQFRQSPQASYSYFILLTSKTGAEEIATGLNSGADDFVSKPVGLTELKARLKAGERIVEMHAQLSDKNRKLNVALDRLQGLYEELGRDLEQARNLQQSLVRETDVALDSGRLSMLLRPSGHVGGDLVGYFKINRRQVGLFSLDVSGHGVSSALMTARLASYLSGTTPDQNVALESDGAGGYIARDPAETAMRLNDILMQEGDPAHYFTLSLSILDQPSGRLRSVQAGHPHAVLQRPGMATALLGTGGLPIGLVSGARYESYETVLCPGDRLVLYSDGITECADESGNLLDEDGLVGLLDTLRAAVGPEMLDDLVWDLQRFSGNSDFEDDVSALVLDYAGLPASPKTDATK